MNHPWHEVWNLLFMDIGGDLNRAFWRSNENPDADVWPWNVNPRRRAREGLLSVLRAELTRRAVERVRDGDALVRLAADELGYSDPKTLVSKSDLGWLLQDHLNTTNPGGEAGACRAQVSNPS